MNIELLKRIRDTLENISVRGRNDMDRMLGCIYAIDKLIEEEKHEHSANHEKSDTE